jgi:hypothetical protein
MRGQLDLAKRSLPKSSDYMIGTNALFRLLLRDGLNGSMVDSIRGSTSAGIGRLIVRASVGRRSQRDLQLAIIVSPVRHHKVVVDLEVYVAVEHKGGGESLSLR